MLLNTLQYIGHFTTRNYMVQNVSGVGVRGLLAVSWIRTVIANMELSRTWWIVSWEGVEFKGKKDPQSFCRFRKQARWRIQENSKARQKETGVWSRASKRRCSFGGLNRAFRSIWSSEQGLAQSTGTSTTVLCPYPNLQENSTPPASGNEHHSSTRGQGRQFLAF